MPMQPQRMPSNGDPFSATAEAAANAFAIPGNSSGRGFGGVAETVAEVPVAAAPVPSAPASKPAGKILPTPPGKKAPTEREKKQAEMEEAVRKINEAQQKFIGDKAKN